MKRLLDNLDARQPSDKSIPIMTRDNRASRISVVARKITPIHLVGNQDFRLNCFLPRHAAGIGDRTRRSGFFFEQDLARIVFQAGPLQQNSQCTELFRSRVSLPSPTRSCVES